MHALEGEADVVDDEVAGPTPSSTTLRNSESCRRRCWFDTGDLARLRADGGIRIAGRVKDLIIRGGENIPVVEVESALYQHPGVAAVAVVGYPDDRLGERICAVVVPDGPAPTLEDLTAHLAVLGMTKVLLARACRGRRPAAEDRIRKNPEVRRAGSVRRVVTGHGVLPRATVSR